MPQLLDADGATQTITVEARALYLCGPYLGALNLNLGCGRGPLPGWVNLDRVGGYGADVVCELGRDLIPLPDASVSCVFASHVLEHIPDIIHAMREIHRVLVPDGILVACTPYAGSDGAWDDPTHVRAFTETSWGYFDKTLYETPEQPGYYPSPVDYRFEVPRVDLLLMPAWRARLVAGEITETEAQAAGSAQRNVYQEMIAYLRKA